MNNDDFDYGAAEADLWESGCPWADEVYDYQSEKGRDEFLRENGLNPDRYRRGGSGSYGSSGTEGCFLTTACVAAKGLPDDCEELQTLRGFRDGWLRKRAGGHALVNRYYEIAPLIVEKINARPDAETVWQQMYAEQILPCVELIKNGEYEAAFLRYGSWVGKLEKTYLPAPSRDLHGAQEDILSRMEDLKTELADFEQTRPRSPGTQEHENYLEWALHLETEIRELSNILERIRDKEKGFPVSDCVRPKPLICDENDFRYLNC